MNIGFSGCSFTYGHEMENPEKTRFSRLLCDRLNAVEFNVSKPGASNEEICMKTIELVENNPIDFMFVQITTSNRFSFIYDNRIVTIRPHGWWISGMPLPLPPLFTKDGSDVDLINKIVFSRDSDFVSWYQLTRWKIIALREYLKNKNIKYIFTFMSELDANLLKNDERIKNKNDFVFTSLQNITDKLPIGKWNHPLEAGHQRIADFLELRCSNFL
jgi:hypothetical protein